MSADLYAVGGRRDPSRRALARMSFDAEIDAALVRTRFSSARGMYVAASADDDAVQRPPWERDTRCVWCLVGAPHSEAGHAALIARFDNAPR